MKVRRVLKERLARGHVEVTLSVERRGGAGVRIQSRAGRRLRRGVSRRRRRSSAPAANPISTRLAHARRAGAPADAADGELEASVLAAAGQAHRAAQPHARGGRPRHGSASCAQRMPHLRRPANEVDKLRARGAPRPTWRRCRSRMQELMEAQADPDRILQEAAILAERSDIQEELVRLHTHIEHFLQTARPGRRSGQEARLPAAGDEPRSQHAAVEDLRRGRRGAAHHGAGLAMKSEIEKAANRCRTSNERHVYIISAPSGSGKSTLVNRAAPALCPTWSFPSRTPRGPRAAASRTAGNISSSPAENSRT